jgi:hypothetical protein
MSLSVRVIPCLDVRDGRVVKGVNFQGLIDIGDPVELASRYNQEGADELTFLDVSASLEGRSAMLSIVEQTADSILSNYKTKMTGRMMADAWHQTLENYNVDVPLKLALAQAHLESGFGQSDLASRKNNPYSLRSGKSYATFSTLQDGVVSYYKTIATKYLKCKTISYNRIKSI